MMTIDGARGKCLWGSIRVPVTSNRAQTACPEVFNNTPPVEYKLPPPDSVWYDCKQSSYGPKVTTITPGWIESANDGKWNPCKHSTIRGNAAYRGISEENCPYVRAASPDLESTGLFQYSRGSFGPSTYVQAIAMTPTNNSYNWVTDSYGNLISRSFWRNPKDYYYYDTIVFPQVLPSAIQSLLPAGASFAKYGEWCGCDVDGKIPPSGIPYDNTRFHYITYSHEAPRIMVRRRIHEYHSWASYTPEESKSLFTISTGLPYLREAASHVETMEITHIRSTAAGVYYIRMSYSGKMEYHGWTIWDYYNGEETQEHVFEFALRILGPGLTSPMIIDNTGLNQYCDIAPERAMELYDSRCATSARTNAVRDVTALDSNWIENLSQIKGTAQVITPLLTGYRAFLAKDLVLARRALAEAYLTYKYVIAPGISDFENITEDGLDILALATKNRFSCERRRGRVINTVPVLDTDAQLTYTTTLHTKLKTNVFGQLWVGLERIGLNPSAANLWDCVPYSFVADWFVKIGNTLSTLAAYDSLRTHRDLLVNIEGYKVQWSLSDTEIGIATGNTLSCNGTQLQYGYYDRKLLNEIGSIDPISIQLTDGDLTLSQMVQGAALITAYKR